MKCGKEERLAFTERAEKIVGELTLEEKVSLMSGSMTFEEVRGAIKKKTREHYNQFPYPAGGLPEHEVPPMLFCDGPRGVVCGNGQNTCFPVSMLRGASFDTELEEEIGEAVAEEVLACGGNLFAGVCINLPYHPGWGRSQETYGEDTFHLGEMGASLVRGVQKHGVMACVKHFAFNQMENGRFKVNVTCDKRTEREIFLGHFKRCIDEGAAAVMSSYNKYQGVMCGHNGYLLNQVLKNEWGFDGFVMSDFVWGVKDTVEAANGGQTMEMCVTKYFGDNLVKAVQSGEVKEAVIDDAALRIIRTILAFEETRKAAGEKPKRFVKGSRQHRKLALASAEEGITLLKNSNQNLPLDRKKVKQIVILGKLANQDNLGDKGSSEVYPPYTVSIAQGIKAAAPECEIVYYDGSDLRHSSRLAENADAVIVVAGYDFNDEGEFVAQDKENVYTGACGGDRKSGIGLHAEDQELLAAAGKANTNCTAVLIGGNTILIGEWAKNISSVVMAYYPGMEGGTALGRILFGDVNPSGKIPFVIPVNESDLPSVNWDAEEIRYDYYHGYEKLDKEGVKPFLPYGFGLSYTTFHFSECRAWQKDGRIFAGCRVKNTGDREGAEIVQMYIGCPESKVDRPVRVLKGFQRVVLEAGEARTIILSCQVQDTAWFNEQTNSFETEHMKIDIYLGDCDAEENLLKTSLVI
ncbi:MAG TPA: glycoside hydrolase family 3 C-terminal domain-containing protein [Lachnospiraceae bacterium]|nr:glycoside hydrolase family 3 C-terminal domain-containing protein [Lachnospiraceae bacterium]